MDDCNDRQNHHNKGPVTDLDTQTSKKVDRSKSLQNAVKKISAVNALTKKTSVKDPKKEE